MSFTVAFTLWCNGVREDGEACCNWISDETVGAAAATGKRRLFAAAVRRGWNATRGQPDGRRGPQVHLCPDCVDALGRE